MKRVVRVMPVLRVLAIFLLLPLGWSRAADWEGGIVLGDEQESTDVSVMVPDAAGVPDEPLPLHGVPTESVPLADVSSPVATAGPGVPYEASACCPTGRPCPHESLDQPGLMQCLAAQKHANWVLRTDALLLWRNAPPSRPLYSTIVPGTDQLGPTALNANELNSDVLVAPRLSLLRTDCDGRTLEATYLYAGNFYSDRALPYVSDGYATSPPGIYGNEWGPPDTNLDSANATLLGQLQSLEFNTRHCIWADTCQFLIGFRWLQWNETLQMQDSFSYADPFVAGNDFYDTRCFNNLWGGQIGLDTLLLGRPGMARVEGLVKAGAYYNNAGQNSTFKYVLSDGGSYENSAGAAGPAACSFVGEVGLTAVLPICCNWDFRCGYFGLWLTGLAQPTRQLSGQSINQFDSAGTLDTAGSVILQGLSLGLEGRW